MSKWLVGSSKSSMCGICHESQANTTRPFCPSDSCLIGAVWAFPVIPYLPITFLISSLSLNSGNFFHIDQLDQGGLPSTVGPYQGQPRVQV